MLYGPWGSHSTNRRDIRRGQVAHRAKWRRAGLGTCRLQRIDRLIGRKVLDEIRDSTRHFRRSGGPGTAADDRPRCAARQRDRTSGPDRRPRSSWRGAPGSGAATNASSGISTPHVRAIAITTRIAPIDVPPASKKLVSAAKPALPANSAMMSAIACSYPLRGGHAGSMTQRWCGKRQLTQRLVVALAARRERDFVEPLEVRPEPCTRAAPLRSRARIAARSAASLSPTR